MADIEVVIKIPEELYKANHRGLEAEELWDLRIAIKNGTPLPKGHGRLGDIDELYLRIGNFIYCNRLAFDVNTIVFMKHILDGIKQTDTIIEADKAESE